MFENLFNLGYNMSRSRISIRTLSKLNYNGALHKDYPMSTLCTFKCGGSAKILIEINTLENFLKVIDYIEKNKFKYFVIGGGSNLLVSDKGYDGIVIKFGGDFGRIERLDETSIECGAGVKLASAYSIARNSGLSGFEDSAGIPATIGGAVFMNASAYEFEMSKIVEYVVAYVNGRITYFNNDECGFGYRSSIFQTNNAIILRIGLRLKSRSVQKIKDRYLEILQKRTDTQPIGYPNAGCIFKRQENIVVSQQIDKCGLKGLTLGDAQVSHKHANFIVNLGEACSQDIYYLIGLVERRFKDKTGIQLETELRFLGEFDENTW